VKKQDDKRPKSVPRYLIPGCGKHGAPGLIRRHVAMLCASIDDESRLFSESCLPNLYFSEQVLKRGPKCMAWARKLCVEKRTHLDSTPLNHTDPFQFRSFLSVVTYPMILDIHHSQMCYWRNAEWSRV